MKISYPCVYVLPIVDGELNKIDWRWQNSAFELKQISDEEGFE